MFSQLFEKPFNGIYLIHLINVNQNVIQVYNDKTVQLFGQDLVDITLKASLSTR